MIGKIFLCIILLFQGDSLFSEHQKIKLPRVKEINNDFISIVDSIIKLEKKCDYYTDSLTFCISVIEYPEKSDTFYIDISSCDKEVIISLKPIAFFTRDDHYFFIHYSVASKLFFPTDSFEIFYENAKDIEDIKIYDDSYSFWLYTFYDDKFSFIKKVSWCDP